MSLRFLSPIHKANRQIAMYVEERCSALGLSATEGHVLSYLRSYSPAPVSELHRVLGIKRSTLTSLLDRLESRGLLERRISNRDRRVVFAALTEPGRLEADGVQNMVEELEAVIGARLPQADLEGFQRVLSAIDAVTEEAAAPGRRPVETPAREEDTQ